MKNDFQNKLARLLSGSRILSEKLNHYGDWSERLKNETYRSSSKPAHILLQELNSLHAEILLSEINPLSALQKTLRLFKYYELLRISWRDWIELNPTDDLLADWSLVADTAVAFALEHSVNLSRLPKDILQHIAIIGLGKLGARELNISSDIDLILMHDGNADFDIESSCTKIIRQLYLLLEAKTAEGFVFRLDWDLRPEGRSGPVAISLNAARSYYESRGEPWERMMLIRARPVAGSLNIAESFLVEMRPFVYRRHTTMEMLENIRKMKQEIAKKRIIKQLDIKHSRGGIREIEFVVGALQLLNAGKITSLQTGNTFKALSELQITQLLPTDHINNLCLAYPFLRRIENAIQVDEDLQTHAFPENTTRLEKLFSTNIKDIEKELEKHRTAVHDIFQIFVSIPPEQIRLTEAISTHQLSCKNIEEELEGLSWSKHRKIRDILADDVGMAQDFTQICSRLTMLAEVLLKEVYQLARKQCLERLGEIELDFAVVGMGSLAAHELDYGSDVDLLFIYESTSSRAKEFAARLAQRIISILSLPQRFGRLYQVDADLRPSGSYGALVTNLEGFLEYQKNDSALWERQALLRGRPLVGDPAFLTRLNPILRDLPFATELPTNAADEINGLRVRMENERSNESENRLDLKCGPGALADIETIVQYLQLRLGPEKKSVRIRNTWNAITALEKAGAFDHASAEALRSNFTYMKRLLAHYRLVTNAHIPHIDRSSDKLTEIGHVLGLGNAKVICESVDKRRKQTREIYESIFSQ